MHTPIALEMLDQERMYTESIVLDRRRVHAVPYMEADEIQQVYDAYYDTRNPVARASECLLGRLLENPECILEYPPKTNFELLVHAADPESPTNRGLSRDRKPGGKPMSDADSRPSRQIP